MPLTNAIIAMKRSCKDNAVIERCLSFKALNECVDRYAAQFLDEGVQEGSRVLMLLEPGIEMMCTFFSLVRIGAIPILMDSGLGIRALIRLGNFSKPDFVACTWKVKLLIACPFFRIKGKVIAIGHAFAKRQRATVVIRDRKPEDTVAILFTSGSTGMAKGVVYKQRNFEDQLNKLRSIDHLTPGGKDVTLLPIFMLFNPMFGRTSIILHIGDRPIKLPVGSVVSAMINLSATSSFGAPVLWNEIAEYCLTNAIKIRSLEQIFLAGVSATTRVLEKIQMIAPNAKIFTPYGSTECLPVCSISAEEILGEVLPLQENGAGTCLGLPVKEIEVKIITVEDGEVQTLEHHLLPLGHVGEIIVAGNNVTESYDQLPEKTAMAKINYGGRIWHRMGDLGFLDERGRLWFCGRKAERVVTEDGEVYDPDCIEPLFHKYSKVERAALIKIVRNGKIRPAIAILPKKDAYPFFFWEKWIFRRELTYLAQSFPKTMVIRDFFFCRTFPVDRRHNAKIHRLSLGSKFSH
ncbi:MAG: AMP-binding protein [Puniceicoccales bacterium]|nr:AMP-binding protein [Puniceicoccales bacterium]